MLRYLGWVLRSLRKDLQLRNYIGIWQKTLAQFGFIGKALAQLLHLSEYKLTHIEIGAMLEVADEQLVAAGCRRRDVTITITPVANFIRHLQVAKAAWFIPITRETLLEIDGGEVRHTVKDSVGRLRLRTRRANSSFAVPPSARTMVLRELARLRLIDFDRYLEAWIASLPKAALNPDTPVLLYLPEVGLRNSRLSAEQLIPFAGITADQGWLGCALSYRALAGIAQSNGLQELTVLEDDAILKSDWQRDWGEARAVIAAGEAKVVSGLISDLADLPANWRVASSGDSRFFVSERFASTVFSVFGHEAIGWLADFPSHATDPNTEGIDRYLATMPQLQVAVFVPPIAKHDAKARSTLWGFSNTTFNAQISQAETLLAEAVSSAAGER